MLIFLCSPKIFALNKWTVIDCEGAEHLNADHIWGLEDNNDLNTKYVFIPWSEYPDGATIKYQFTVDKNGAKVYCEDEAENGFEFPLNDDNKPFGLLTDEYNDTYLMVAEKEEDGGSRIGAYGENNSSWWYTDMDLSNGRCFLLGENIYWFNYSNGKFYKIDLRNDIVATAYKIQYAPKKSTSVVIVKDTVYYFSKSGFCAMKISGTSTTANLIKEVAVKDATSLLVTDHENRIWIINSKDGVVEYNISKKKSQKIATAPPVSARDSRVNPYKNICFYIENFLYYIANQKVYRLDSSHPDDPKENKIPWIGPITPAYQFTAPAKFFRVLDTIYMKTIYNGYYVLFEYDPITDNFYSVEILDSFNTFNTRFTNDSYDSASNIIQNEPVVSSVNYNHTFSDKKFLYSYDSASNTITCKNIKTKMTKKIACYENMPEDIVQIVYANNLVYILTESGKNHIARIAGSNLKYVSGWKLNNCTPRTGVAIVTMNNAIYVFGGKALADDSKEASSGTCYNELYVYDIATKSSKKLEVPEDVTARYDAKMVASQRSGKLWILSGKDDSDSKALDVWEYDTRSQKWDYINEIPESDGDDSVCYDDKNDILTLLITPESEESNLFSMNDYGIPQASSGGVMYKLQNLATSTNTPDQSGHNCGCLGLEFIFALIGLFIFRHCRKD